MLRPRSTFSNCSWNPGSEQKFVSQKALYATSTILILCRKEKNISTKGKKKSSTRQESPPQLRPARTDGAAPPARSHHHRKDGAGQTGNGAMREEQEDCTIRSDVCKSSSPRRRRHTTRTSACPIRSEPLPMMPSELSPSSSSLLHPPPPLVWAHLARRGSRHGSASPRKLPALSVTSKGNKREVG
jgi:hypothetical protein